VSGFGLLGHLGEMLEASGVDAALDTTKLPILPGAVTLLGRGVRSSLHAANESARRHLGEPESERPVDALLFDPQTSGGLLVGIDPARASGFLRALVDAGDTSASIIGEIRPGSGRVWLEPSQAF
jgi:selenide,water dikinase